MLTMEQVYRIRRLNKFERKSLRKKSGYSILIEIIKRFILNCKRYSKCVPTCKEIH